MAVIDSLMAWYPLDEASGNAIDAHSGAHHMTETSGIIAAATGPGGVGGARDFEMDDTEYFGVADHADLSMGDFDFSLAAWVKLEGPQNPRGSLINKTGPTSTEFEVLFDGYDNSGEFVFRIASGASYANFTDVHASDFGVAVGATWYFVVARHDATANTIDLGVNAGTQTSASYSAGGWDNSYAFAIGGGTDAGMLDGLLAQVGVWKKKLTSDEITWLYNAGAGRSYADIVAEGATFDTFRPSGVLSAGSWTANPSGTLYGVTSDESDSTSAQSSSGSGSDTLDLSFPAMATPPAGTVTFYIRHKAT